MKWQNESTEGPQCPQQSSLRPFSCGFNPAAERTWDSYVAHRAEPHREKNFSLQVRILVGKICLDKKNKTKNKHLKHSTNRTKDVKDLKGVPEVWVGLKNSWLMQFSDERFDLSSPVVAPWNCAGITFANIRKVEKWSTADLTWTESGIAATFLSRGAIRQVMKNSLFLRNSVCFWIYYWKWKFKGKFTLLSCREKKKKSQCIYTQNLERLFVDQNISNTEERKNWH